MTHRRTWQKEEQEVCADFGGSRRGPDYGDWSGGGKNDCKDTPGFSIEVKVHAKPSFGVMLADAQRAVDRKKHPNDIGMATMRKKGAPKSERVVVMLYDEFREHFGGSDGTP